MKHIIERIVRFTKEKKTKKKTKTKEAEKEVKEETPEPEEKPAIDVQAILSGMAEEMESRTMLLQGEVNEEQAGEIISGFLALAELTAPKKELQDDEMPYDPITMYVSTYGGSADEMFAIFDIMNHCKKSCHIETIGIGKVMSAGTLILAAGTKGKRKISKNCRVMLHQVSAGAFGPLFNMTTEIDAIQKLQFLWEIL